VDFSRYTAATGPLLRALIRRLSIIDNPHCFCFFLRPVSFPSTPRRTPFGVSYFPFLPPSNLSKRKPASAQAQPSPPPPRSCSTPLRIQRHAFSLFNRILSHLLLLPPPLSSVTTSATYWSSRPSPLKSERFRHKKLQLDLSTETSFFFLPLFHFSFSFFRGFFF